MKKLMSARGCAVSDAARQSPGAALVDYLVTAYGLAGFEQDLTLRLNAFWAEAVAAERRRIAQRVSEREIVRLSVGRDPLAEVNEIIQDLAYDIATDWEHDSECND
jgi:hypothetical protein